MNNINNKSKQVNFRCSEEDKAKIENMAKELGISIGKLIIFCLNEGTSYKNLKKFLGR